MMQAEEHPDRGEREDRLKDRKYPEQRSNGILADPWDQSGQPEEAEQASKGLQQSEKGLVELQYVRLPPSISHARARQRAEHEHNGHGRKQQEDLLALDLSAKREHV